MNDPPLKICPECGSEVRRLIFGGTGVIFKGSGFYVTDKGKSGKTAGKPCPANGSSSQKPDSAPCACCPNAAGQASKQASQDSSGPAAGSSSEKPGRQSKSA